MTTSTCPASARPFAPILPATNTQAGHRRPSSPVRLDELGSEHENERGQLLSAWPDQPTSHPSDWTDDEDDEDQDNEDDEDDEGEEDDEAASLDRDDKRSDTPKAQPSNCPTELSAEPGSSLLSDERRQKLKRRRRRRLYGGGRFDAGGQLEVWEVALGMASDILSPAPLLVPHAFLLLSLPIGLPVLFLSAFLAWFSHVVLVVCGRYVGGRTYAQIASAVFPDRCRGFNLWFGESIVELARVLMAAGRGMVNMMMVSDLFAQLTRQYTPHASILYSRLFIILFVGLLSLIPNFLRPRRPIFLPASFPTLSRLPLFLTALWPIALAIIGFRLRQLNKELGRKLPPSGEGDVYSEIMGGTVWGGFSWNTFTHLRSLKRINKPPGGTHPMVPIGSSATPDPNLNAHVRTSSYTLRRYSWEISSFLGVLYACLVCLGWGLVGYLGMDHGGYEVNFLASLPSADPWISASRALLLLVLIPSIPLSLRPATTALFHLARIPFQIHTAASRRRRLRSRGAGPKLHQIDAEWDDADEDEKLVGPMVWAARAVTMVIWAAVAIGAVRFGGSNGGEGSSIELLGCVGSTLITGIIPARSIFITDPGSSEGVRDELLIRKESQLQRRLNGRRLWQDVGVFGLLLPYCLVVLFKGLLAAFATARIGLSHERSASWST